TKLLGVIGLMLAGGLLLLWGAWKLYREARGGGHHHLHLDHQVDGNPQGRIEGSTAQSTGTAVAVRPKTFGQALVQIVVADVSMSLDNVLAVAGTARHHLWVLVVGLALSVALMG